MSGFRRAAVLGCGTMAGALLAGLLDVGALSADEVVATARSRSHREEIAGSLGVRVTGDNAEAVRGADLVLLGVKPYAALDVLGEVVDSLSPRAVVVSIAAGITTEALSRVWSGPVVRVMPNTPVKVGRGAFIVSPAAGAEDAGGAVVELLKGVGTVVEVPEHLHDAATAVSGSGPAYVFLFAEAMIDAAVGMGLPRGQASELVTATIGGSAELLSGGEHPAVLRNMVTSPGGTTATALARLEAHGLRTALADAMEACRARAGELG